MGVCFTDFAGSCGYTQEIYGPELVGPPDWEVPASVAQYVPGLETGDDLLTFFTGCGYVCQAGGEDPVGWGWRTVSGVALVAPVGGAMARNMVESGFDFIRRNGDEILGSTADFIRRAGCSFSEDTLVTTADSLVPISEVETGTYVLAYNEETGEIGYYPVTAVWAHLDPVIVRLTIDGEVILTTPEHPFFTAEGEWVAAADLQLGDDIRTAEWLTGTLEEIAFLNRPQVMYNFTVDVAHTYFVGEEQWLVHNNCFDGLGYLGRETAIEIQAKVDEVGEPLYVVGSATRRPNFNDIDYATISKSASDAYRGVDLPGMEHPAFPADPPGSQVYGSNPLNLDLGAIEFNPGKAPIYHEPYIPPHRR